VVEEFNFAYKGYKMNRAINLIFIVGILGVVFETANGFCFHAVGGVGEYHQECDPHDTGVEYDACYARCNCWSDFPDMGGEKIGELDALCMMDACWCNHNLAACPFGTLKTNTFCCNTVASGYTCKDFDCDTDGNCEPKTFKGLIETLAKKS